MIVVSHDTQGNFYSIQTSVTKSTLSIGSYIILLEARRVALHLQYNLFT